VIPLVSFVTSKGKMGTFAVRTPVAVLAWGVATIIVALNLKLLYDTFAG
jgi:manganese transport protein